MTTPNSMQALQRMYESFPFPQRDKGHAEVGTVLANRLVDLGFSGRGRWLDLGCGTGEILTAAAERLPDTEFRGVDFSKTSHAFFNKSEVVPRGLGLDDGLPGTSQLMAGNSATPIKRRIGGHAANST